MVLESRRISKSFHTKQVLNGIDFRVGRGEVHGLVGKNGAGKSTFVNIVTGLIRDYAGEVYFDGESIDGESVLSRQRRGLFLVPQHSSVVPEFSVAENIFIGVWPRNRRGGVDWPAMHAAASRELKRYGVDIDPRTKVRHLSLVERRKLNIVRALFAEAKLIILDEPTTSLTREERDNLFSFIRELAAKGTSFIFISHYLDEVVKLCDRITVFRDGSAQILDRDQHHEAELSEHIVGESVELFQRPSRPGVEREHGFSAAGLSGLGFRDVDFTAGAGEIVGLVGFPGSGARETMRGLAGLAPIEGGRLALGPERREIAVGNPAEAIDQGVVYVPHDRHDEGLAQEMSILENISLAIVRTALRRAGGRIDKPAERRVAERYYDYLRIKAKGLYEKVRVLSGGNQQKVLVAKAFSCEPKLLMLDEPTIGIDIGSREEILALVDELASRGVAVLYHTSDYSEMLRICDRVLFFAQGAVRRSVDNAGLDIDQVAAIRDEVSAAR